MEICMISLQSPSFHRLSNVRNFCRITSVLLSNNTRAAWVVKCSQSKTGSLDEKHDVSRMNVDRHPTQTASAGS
jgi:hypothetical protein